MELLRTQIAFVWVSDMLTISEQFGSKLLVIVTAFSRTVSLEWHHLVSRHLRVQFTHQRVAGQHGQSQRR